MSNPRPFRMFAAPRLENKEEVEEQRESEEE
jgi:hypothetical protein